jgi:hypothetical protein
MKGLQKFHSSTISSEKKRIYLIKHRKLYERKTGVEGSEKANLNQK